MNTKTRTYPETGRTYWAAMTEPGVEWTTVYGSYHGARVDSSTPGRDDGAALFTTREAAESYRGELAAWREGHALGNDVPGVVAPVVYVGGTYYRTAVVAPSTSQTDGRKPQRGDVFEVHCHAADGTYVPLAHVVAHAVVKMNDGTYRVETCRPGSTDTRSMHVYVDRTGAVLDAPAPCGTCPAMTFSSDGVTFDAFTGAQHKH